MRKSELRALRALPATKEMMEKGKRYEERTETRWYNKKKYTVIVPEYDLLVRVQNLNGYIKVALFLPEMMRKDIKTPKYEIFVNQKGNEWITRELDAEGKEKRWLTSMITNLDQVELYRYCTGNVKIFLNSDGMKTLNKLEVDKCAHRKGLWRLQRWQQEQRDKQIEEKEKKEQEPWDKDMELIPKVAPGFKEWMRKDVAQEYYIFYKYDPKGAKIGYCSRCKREVAISRPKHGLKTRCPRCKAEAEFKSSGRIKTLSTHTYEAQVIQKIKGGIVIRTFEQRQYYREAKYKEPYIDTRECERVLIFEGGTIKRYEWTSYKNKKMRWVLDERYYPGKRTWFGSDEIKLYKRNLTQLKKHSLLKQSAINLWEKLPVSAESYLVIEKGNPAVEMLAKIGMFRLSKGIIRGRYDVKLLDQRQTEIAKMLKIDKARLKRLKEMDANAEMLRWMQFEKMHNTIWPDEMIKDFGNALFSTAELNFLKIPISFVKSYNYMKKQAAIMGEGLKQVLTTWRDYINMAEQMKMNTEVEQIAKPKDLKFAHDELVLMTKTKGLEKQAKDIEKKWPKVNEQLPKLKKFEFTLNEYTIVAPDIVLDIVKEGVVLSHCVHACDYYFERIQNDESYLFFLRKSKQPDMPWYTLEVEPSGNIRQKRTTGDNQNADFDKAVKFLKKWQQYFKKQLTKEEEELGKKADELRKKNYKQLRKDGNRVWHGKLQGQLLADVLEADFMEAIG